MFFLEGHRSLAPAVKRPASLAAALISILLLLAVSPLQAQMDKAKSKRPSVAPTEAIVVFLVRHAEKSSNDPKDPDLSKEGLARADVLARILSGAGVTHLFSTEYKRTKQTLAALAKASGVEVIVVGAREMGEQLETLRGLAPGSVAVVAGHSNTVPAMVAGLAGEARGIGLGGEAPNLAEDEYDALFQVIIPPPGRARRFLKPSALELKYGE